MPGLKRFLPPVGLKLRTASLAHPHPHKKNQIWILCRNSLTRELKIRVVGFVLKKLLVAFLYFTSFDRAQYESLRVCA